MGEARRRRNGLAVVKAASTPVVEILRVVKLNRIEETYDDGIVYARTLFRVLNDKGKTMMEMTPEGPKPVMLSSVPQPIRHALLQASGLVTR